MDAARMGKDLAEARQAWEVSIDALAAQCQLELDEVRAAEEGAGAISTFATLASALGGSLDELVEGRPFWRAPSVALRSGPGPLDAPLVRATLLRLSSAAAARWAASALGTDFDPPLEIEPVAVVGKPAEQAEELAKKVRALLENPHDPLASVRDVLRRFGFATFLTSFPTTDIDGVSWRDADGRGHAAVNVEAREGGVTAMRMTFAHELCHLLFDGLRGDTLGILEKRGPENDKEKRANAFAAYLLAPRSAVGRLLRPRGLPFGKPPNAQDVLALSTHFMMGVEAVANHLVSLGRWQKDDIYLHRSLRTELRHGSDSLEKDTSGPIQLIALERRGEVLDLATRALADGRISVARWRELVDVGPHDDYQSVLARQGLRNVEYSSM